VKKSKGFERNKNNCDNGFISIYCNTAYFDYQNLYNLEIMALTRNKMIRALMLEEKGKSEAKIHDVRQIIADLSDWLWQDSEAIHLLLSMGKARQKRGVAKENWWKQYIN
jgi:hypothetical protein